MTRRTPDADPALTHVVGIGFGPANIALAIAAQELDAPYSIQFLERNAGPGWQEEMLLPESDIQNHPLRDLVTPRNPRSRYTFVNFLHEHGRLFEHLNLPLSHPLRLEYRQYVLWVAQQFKSQVRYDSHVESIVPVVEKGRIAAYDVHCSDGHRVRAAGVVLAPGRTPHVPEAFTAVADERVVHLTRFLQAFEKLAKRPAPSRIAIVGGSQTAVELLLHVANRREDVQLTGITRNFGYRLKDTSPFSDEVYFPEFVDRFFNATDAQKDRLRQELKFTNYSASDRDVLDALYVHQYRDRITGRQGLRLQRLTEVSQVQSRPDGVTLTLRHVLDGSTEQHDFDLVVLATGFKDIGGGPAREAYPALMADVAPHLLLRNDSLDVALDYQVRLRDDTVHHHAPFFLNGLCESSHGMGDAGSFSLLSLRSAAIVRGLQNRLTVRQTAEAL